MQTDENMTGRNARAHAAINFSVTTRDELEAVIWRSAPRLSSAAVDAILRAADDYATAQCVTAICAPTIAAAQARRLAALDAALAAIELRGRYERKAA